MRPVGFSTGAIAYSDFSHALDVLMGEPVNCVELSALRLPEVAPLLSSVGNLPLDQYTYVSFHAPSSFTAEQEHDLVSNLVKYLPRSWPIVLHPDTIHDAELWRGFGAQLAIENMDRRKLSGRTAHELAGVFDEIPDAVLCFDIGHARQCDTSMTEAYEILRRFQPRLRQVHISEVNTRSQHDPLSFASKVAFQQVANLIPEDVPIIIESRVEERAIRSEIQNVQEALCTTQEAVSLHHSASRVYRLQL